MSTAAQASAMLAKRDSICGYRQYYDSYYRRCVEYSGWYWWGRWVLTGIIFLACIIVLILIMRTSARRRRARGMTPVYGTAWIGPKPGPYQQPPQQNAGYYAPPPQYTPNPNQQQPQYTGTTFNPNDGYYSGHNEGVQPPPNTYAPPNSNNATTTGDNYAPPPGPPPGK